MASVTDVPAYYFDKSSAMPSGESFRRAEAPLNKKLDDRLAMLGVTWHDFFDYCLAVNGTSAADAYMTWEPPESYDDLESWQTAAAQQTAGVSWQQTLKERGFSDEMIATFPGPGPAASPVPPGAGVA